MKIYNLPIECSVDIYDEAIKEYVNIVSKYPEVVSIVQIGNVGVAGISDIDLVVYLDDTVKCNNNYSLYQIDKKYHQVLMHDVFIIPYRLMSESFLITSIFDTKVAYGKMLELQDYTDENKSKENLILLNDICCVSLLFEYDNWYTMDKKNIKLIIARLNSIKYPIILLNRICDFNNITIESKNIYAEFVNEFAEFRKKWFLIEQSDRITKLLIFVKKAKNTIAPLLIKDTIKINNIISNYNISGDKLLFTLGKEQIKGAPLLFVNLVEYSKENGPTSSHLRKNMETNIIIDEINSEYQLLLKKRIFLINQCFEFLNKNKIRYGELWAFGARQNISIFERVFNKLKRIIIK